MPHLPDYESYRDERLETLMTQGASERALRMRATMRPDQSFNNDKRFLDLLLRKSGTTARQSGTTTRQSGTTARQSVRECMCVEPCDRI